MGRPMRAKGGRIKPGPAWHEGVRSGTQVQNNPTGKSDQHDVNRKRPITYKTGGAVFAPGTMKEPRPFSGADEHPSGMKGIAGLKVKGGGGGARSRLAKIRKYGP
jgi:hypothetical protein